MKSEHHWAYHRQLIVIHGELSDALRMAKQSIGGLNSVWLSDIVLQGIVSLPMKQATTLLSQEFEAVVFNLHRPSNDNSNTHFNANAFGAVTGTIVGGGYFILLLPQRSEHSQPRRFLQRFYRLLTQAKRVVYYDKKNPPPLFVMPSSTIEQSNETVQAKKEQTLVFDAMLRVVEGHRRRPLVLTADRGRGKSTLLGQFAAHLLQQSPVRHLIVTAPSRKIADTLFSSAKQTLENSVSAENAADLLKGLRFLSPDALSQQSPDADLVLVDEAASLPLPMLMGFVRRYSRLIFATTEHGYEGSGRGFSIRLYRVLDHLSPNWHHAELKAPFRWAINDPLEQFTFDLLLLKTEPMDIATIPRLSLQDCHLECLSQQRLVKDEQSLKALFSLLVSAHYQTRPSDLVRLLDHDNDRIFILCYQNKTIATALLTREGGFSSQLAEAIYNGQRRPQGHLIPQTLATHAGIKQAPCLTGYRIMRIAVQPELQGQGVGSFLLKALTEQLKTEANVDYIATSFGATSQLITFWSRANFVPLYLGMKRDASSGRHSLVMLKPFNTESEHVSTLAQYYFSEALPLLLADPLRTLETDLISTLFQHLRSPSLLLTTAELDALHGFCEQQRAYESCLVAIYKLTLVQLSQQHRLSAEVSAILIAKVLQKQSWAALVTLMGFSGKKQAIKQLRQAVKQLVYQYSMNT